MPPFRASPTFARCSRGHRALFIRGQRRGQRQLAKGHLGRHQVALAAQGDVFGQYQLIYSPASIVVALVCSSLIGIGFGFIPARNASKLDPVVALARD